MFDWRSPAEWKRLWRYYQAGVLNTLFGYGLFSILVAAHVNLYAAQALSHVAGMAFNYLTYSRYAFRDRQASKSGFVVSYAVNYLLGLGFIWSCMQVWPSPYAAGLISTVLVSIINYFVLGRLAFKKARA
ncbi:MAG: GtrA family protein [Alphaproteobacteria bacterium]|uniref:GtrA family protein n=1 Tax=Novosphingobium anseongense TaxID=3133436 RepID=A0ABU8RW95_9SPHN|nr:MAG: GtrA family protein [Alphaproteobacteria bacterium]